MSTPLLLELGPRVGTFCSVSLPLGVKPGASGRAPLASDCQGSCVIGHWARWIVKSSCHQRMVPKHHCSTKELGRFVCVGAVAQHAHADRGAAIK